MDEKETIEKLQKELEAAKAENKRLEEEMNFKDKLTGLWNRKYAEKILKENSIGADMEDFTIVCTDIDNLNLVNDISGPDAGDAVVKNIADGLRQSFGEGAICSKLAGAKMCVFTHVSKEELDEDIHKFEVFAGSVAEHNKSIEVNLGFARKDDNADMNAEALMKEAEYALQMSKVNSEHEQNTPEVGPRTRYLGDKITVLMIDDSPVILRTLQMMLKDNYQVLMATSGMEGYEIAKSKNPDLILLDYNMPVVDGARIMQLLKKSNSTKNIPVIFITGVSDKEKILKVATLKPAGYLLKPVEKENLLFTISSVLKL